MKHPCMAMCEATNRKVIRNEVRERGGVPEHGGGGRGREGWVMVGQHSLESGCCNETSSDFNFPPDSDRSKSIFFFQSEIHQGLCVSHIVISPTYHPALVKTEYKGAAAPSHFLSSHTPLPCTILLHYELVDTDFPFFPPPVSSFFMFAKEVVVFWQQCQWDQKNARVSPPSKRIDDAELF